MSWKSDRVGLDRRGWGDDALSRWIGRQRREAARPTGAKWRGLNAAQAREIERLMAEADEMFARATAVYESVPAKVTPMFDEARALYVEAERRRDLIRIIRQAARVL